KAGNLGGQRPPRRVAHRRKRGCGTAAVTMTQNDNLMSTGGQFSRVHGGVVGFGPTVGKERFFQTAGCDLMKFLCQIRLRLISIKSGRVLQGLDLINDCFGDPWVSVAHTYGEHAAETVEVLITLIVPNVKTLAARKRDWL